MNELQEGAWIFVSHSNKDWTHVKFVRDYLENKGHRPLLFFLKCLEEDSEINDLIKREIESRNWFILCESENSRKSKWVQAELDYIKHLKGKVYETIDLDDSAGLDGQLYKLDRLSKRITIFPSYDWRDPQNEPQEILNILKRNDYFVFDTMEMQSQLKSSGRRWDELIEQQHYKASQEGFFLLIISNGLFEENGIKAMYEDELRAAIRRSKTGSNIIIISLIHPEDALELLSNDFKQLIADKKIWDFSKGILAENVVKLIEELKIVEIE